jgi:predicted transcriptional regulator
MRQRRGAVTLVYDILSLCRNGAAKTQIIYQANLSFKLASLYIDFLLGKGLFRKELDSKGRMKYLLTYRGERLLHHLREVERELAELFPLTPTPKPSALPIGSPLPGALRQRKRVLEVAES